MALVTLKRGNSMQPAKGARMKDGAIHTLELGAHEAAPIHGRYGRLLLSICRGFALGGGAIFVSLVFRACPNFCVNGADIN